MLEFISLIFQLIFVIMKIQGRVSIIADKKNYSNIKINKLREKILLC